MREQREERDREWREMERGKKQRQRETEKIVEKFTNVESKAR